MADPRFNQLLANNPTVTMNMLHPPGGGNTGAPGIAVERFPVGSQGSLSVLAAFRIGAIAGRTAVYAISGRVLQGAPKGPFAMFSTTEAADESVVEVWDLFRIGTDATAATTRVASPLKGKGIKLLKYALRNEPTLRRFRQVWLASIEPSLIRQYTAEGFHSFAAGTHHHLSPLGHADTRNLTSLSLKPWVDAQHSVIQASQLQRPLPSAVPLTVIFHPDTLSQIYETYVKRAPAESLLVFGSRNRGFELKWTGQEFMTLDKMDVLGCETAAFQDAMGANVNVRTLPNGGRVGAALVAPGLRGMHAQAIYKNLVTAHTHPLGTIYTRNTPPDAPLNPAALPTSFDVEAPSAGDFRFVANIASPLHLVFAPEGVYSIQIHATDRESLETNPGLAARVYQQVNVAISDAAFGSIVGMYESLPTRCQAALAALKAQGYLDAADTLPAAPPLGPGGTFYTATAGGHIRFTDDPVYHTWYLAKLTLILKATNRFLERAYATIGIRMLVVFHHYYSDERDTVKALYPAPQTALRDPYSLVFADPGVFTNVECRPVKPSRAQAAGSYRDITVVRAKEILTVAAANPWLIRAPLPAHMTADAATRWTTHRDLAVAQLRKRGLPIPPQLLGAAAAGGGGGGGGGGAAAGALGAGAGAVGTGAGALGAGAGGQPARPAGNGGVFASLFGQGLDGAGGQPARPAGGVGPGGFVFDQAFRDAGGAGGQPVRAERIFGFGGVDVTDALRGAGGAGGQPARPAGGVGPGGFVFDKAFGDAGGAAGQSVLNPGGFGSKTVQSRQAFGDAIGALGGFGTGFGGRAGRKGRAAVSGGFGSLLGGPPPGGSGQPAGGQGFGAFGTLGGFGTGAAAQGGPGGGAAAGDTFGFGRGAAARDGSAARAAAEGGPGGGAAAGNARGFGSRAAHARGGPGGGAAAAAQIPQRILTRFDKINTIKGDLMEFLRPMRNVRGAQCTMWRREIQRLFDEIGDIREDADFRRDYDAIHDKFAFVLNKLGQIYNYIYEIKTRCNYTNDDIEELQRFMNKLSSEFDILKPYLDELGGSEFLFFSRIQEYIGIE